MAIAEPPVNIGETLVPNFVTNEDAKTDAQLQKAKQTDKNNSKNDNLLILVGADSEDKASIEARVKRLSKSQDDNYQIISVEDHDKIADVLTGDSQTKVLASKSKSRLKQLGILFFNKNNIAIANFLGNRLQRLIFESAKRVEKMYLAAKSNIKSKLLTTNKINDLEAVNTSVADHLADEQAFVELTRSVRDANNDAGNAYINHTGIHSIVFKPNQGNTEAPIQSFFPFVDKIFNLETS